MGDPLARMQRPDDETTAMHSAGKVFMENKKLDKIWWR